MQFPFRPIKGQAFRLYFSVIQSNSSLNISDGTSASRRCYVSKDGGALTVATNSVAIIASPGSNTSPCLFYIDLTASEMDADNITVSGTFGSNSSTTNGSFQIHIYTTSPELSSAPSLNSSIADKIPLQVMHLVRIHSVLGKPSRISVTTLIC